MPQIVEVPGYGEVEFPDDMNDDQIAQAIRANMDVPAPQQADAPRPTAQPATTGSKVARGMIDPIEGGAQLLYNVMPQGFQQAGDKLNNWLADKGVPLARVPQGGMNQLAKQNESAYQASRAAAGESGFDGMRLAGNVLSPANLAVASRTMSAIPAATTLGKVAGGAVSSGVQGALMPVTQGDYWSEKGKQAGTSAAVGGALPILGKMIPKRTEEAKALLKQGVKVPFLQQFGQGAGRFEDKLQSVPLVGDAIRSSRLAAQDQFNRSTWDKVLAPLGQTLPKNAQTGNKAAEHVQKAISQSYDDVLGKIGFKADQQFTSDIGNLRNLAASLPDEQAAQLERILKTEVFDRMTPAGLMSGESIKRAESRLGEKMRTAMRSQNVWDGDLADALHEAQAIIRSTLERQNPAHAPKLQAINKAQAMAYRPERAASMLGAKDGVFTPAQLLSAVKAKDPSKNHRAFAQGRALMQDWAQQADNTLSSKIPDSGTAERLMLGGASLGGLSLVPTGGQVAAGLAMLPYLPGGRALGRGVANTLEKTGNTLTNRAPYAALPLSPALYGLLYGGQDK